MKIRILNAVATLMAIGVAGCGGGGGGGGDGTPSVPTISSFRSAATSTADVDASQLAVSSFGGVVPSSAPALLAVSDSPFTFDTAHFERSSGPDSLVLEWSQTLEDGREHSIRARFNEWHSLSDLAPGLSVGLTDIATLRGYRASEYDRPAGAALEGIFLDGAGTVALSYTSFGYWSFFDTFTDGGEQFVASGGVSIGQVSPDLGTIAGLPATATYRGTTVGSIVAVDQGLYLAMAGKIALTANFETDRLSATISDVKLFDGDAVHSTDPGDTIAFSGIAITPATASFQGSTDSGMSVMSGSEALDGSAAFTGHFYGPTAEEIGGTWGTVESDPDLGTVHASGTFGAKR